MRKLETLKTPETEKHVDVIEAISKAFEKRFEADDNSCYSYLIDLSEYNDEQQSEIYQHFKKIDLITKNDIAQVILVDLEIWPLDELVEECKEILFDVLGLTGGADSLSDIEYEIGEHFQAIEDEKDWEDTKRSLIAALI